MKLRPALVCTFLVVVGSLQIVAEAFAWPRVRAFAAALQLSPAMKVFTAHEGYETHAAQFSLTWLDADGGARLLPLNPESYAGVRGPYNRRNVYGAALAYGPLLRADPKLRAMQQSVMSYAFCEPGSLRTELGIPAGATRIRAHVTASSGRSDLESTWEVHCHE